MQLEIVTPDENLYKGEVSSVIFPGSDGSFGILEAHAAIVSTLKEGEIKIIENDNKETSFNVKGGVVEVNNNAIIVLAE
jgi:F-type H+-transporting ATPase subunit epsilon